MNESTIEFIKSLIPLLETAGEGSFWLLVILLGEGYVTALLTSGVLIYLFFKIGKVITTSIGVSRDHSELKRWADDIGKTVMGVYFDNWSPSDRRSALAMAKKWKEERESK